MRNDFPPRFFKLWFAFVAVLAVAWIAFLAWAVVQGIDILRLLALTGGA